MHTVASELVRMEHRTLSWGQCARGRGGEVGSETMDGAAICTEDEVEEQEEARRNPLNRMVHCAYLVLRHEGCRNRGITDSTPGVHVGWVSIVFS